MLDTIKNSCENVICDQFGNKYQLKDFEIPNYYEIIPELPRKAGTEKVDYQLLEEMALE